MYTTAAKVRALLPTLLIDDDDLGTSYSGTNLVLNYPAYDVPTILQNEIVLVKDTGFTFERPDKITLTNVANGERYIAQSYRGISDGAIDDIIESVDRIILSEFTNNATPPSDYLEDWSSVRSAARYLRMYCSGTEENLDKSKALEKSVKDDITDYKSNTPKKSSNIIVKVNR